VTVSARLPAVRRRRQLLDVALEIFARDGYHSTSMDALAAAAGVTKPVLYQHFRSKRELYLELLGDVGDRLLERIEKAVATASGPRQQVEAGFGAYARFVEENESAFRLLFVGSPRAPGPDTAQFADALRRVEEAIADAVAALIEADIDDGHRRMLAHGIVGMAEGTVRDWLRNGRPVPADVLGRRLAGLAWAGLRGVRPT